MLGSCRCRGRLFDITDGGLTNQRTWADLGETAAPDGISEDSGTTLYVAAAEWRGMTELVTPGSGQVLAIPGNDAVT